MHALTFSSTGTTEKPGFLIPTVHLEEKKLITFLLTTYAIDIH